ncbi:putative dephospho-CoA kinase [Maudiozyma humilis]|uniref:Dephospho-CoA kinase n=1 Tax=Maudiozyma humilis TaxID=51915 RepID=A0AAV5S040_MAUHU|nr:putative dephospho-CoA kinase [Kazachstania humilis]
MLIVGLTGGIACGKSTVSRRLQEKYKLPIVDADKIAREVVMPGTSTYNSIVEHFKENIPDLISQDGSLNRPALGSFVFSHPDELKVLNGITHPAIRYQMLKEVMNFCGVTISVICDEDTQLERLLVRNISLSTEEARNRIKSQMPMKERKRVSDYTIENNGSLPELYNEIDRITGLIRPTNLRTVLEYFPPFGAVSAGAIIASKWIEGKPKYNKKNS